MNVYLPAGWNETLFAGYGPKSSVTILLTVLTSQIFTTPFVSHDAIASP